MLVCGAERQACTYTNSGGVSAEAKTEESIILVLAPNDHHIKNLPECNPSLLSVYYSVFDYTDIEAI